MQEIEDMCDTKSSWISSILYKRTPDGASYVSVFLKGADAALLYGGPTSPIPSWLPGLLLAGTGRRSVGLAYNRLLKGKYEYQRVEGKESVNALKEMMS